MASVLALGVPWAADNGAYSGFKPDAFRRFLTKIQDSPRCLFVACPDVVEDAKATVERYLEWNLEIMATGMPVAFVLQDGQEDLDLPDADAYFIGGSTEFKLSETAHEIVTEAKYRPSQLNGPPQNRWIHMGRVNSKKRMTLAYQTSVDSVDGTGMSMFGDAHIQKFCEHSGTLQEEGYLFRPRKF